MTASAILSGRLTGYANIGEKLDRAGRFDEASAHAEMALDLARANGHVATAWVTDILARIRLHQERYPEAGSLAEEAADLLARAGATGLSRDALRLAAEAWRAAGSSDRSEETAARADLAARELSGS